MQFLGFAPGAVIPVFPEVFNHQPDIFEVTDAGLGVPEPKAFRMLPHQRPRVLDQLRRRGRGRRQLVQRVRSITHGISLLMRRGGRKVAVKSDENHQTCGPVASNVCLIASASAATNCRTCFGVVQ